MCSVFSAPRLRDIAIYCGALETEHNYYIHALDPLVNIFLSIVTSFDLILELHACLIAYMQICCYVVAIIIGALSSTHLP